MDDPAQGIVDKPVSDEEMAAIDQAASQFGAIVQPTTTQPAYDQPISTSSQNDSTSSGPVDDDGVTPMVKSASSFLDPSSAPNAVKAEDTGETEQPGLAQTSKVNLAPISPATPPIDINQLVAEEEAKAAEAASASVVEPTSAPEPVQADTPAPLSDPLAQALTPPAGVTPGQGTNEELLGVKQKALEQLTPIVDTINLPAEERFDTLMMVIRASDDKRLIQPAYDAANEIPDPDKRAKALLDVVNEVNYLTQLQADQE